MTAGQVRVWHAERGWGVLDSDDTPGGCWVHFSAFSADAVRDRPLGAYSVRGGFGHLIDGETVDFEWEQTRQDGYDYRATAVRPRRETPAWDVRLAPSGSVGTALFIDLDEADSGVVDIDSPDWVVAVAESLVDYVREAAALPPPDGRTPWIHMTDVAATCSGNAITLGFRWRLDEPSSAPRYLVTFTPMRAEPVIASDGMITRLDLFLDNDRWQDLTLPAGPDARFVMLPPRGSTRDFGS